MVDDTGIDEKTVRNVFDEYVAELERDFGRSSPTSKAGR